MARPPKRRYFTKSGLTHLLDRHPSLTPEGWRWARAEDYANYSERERVRQAKNRKRRAK